MLDTPDLDQCMGWQCIQEQGYKICQSGSHIKGNFIRVFIPASPYRDQEGKVKVIVYLHGFALCMPRFYETHLKRLVEQGYYVLFPDFQKSDYPDNTENRNEMASREEKKHLSFWLSLVRDLILKGNSFSIEKFFSEEQKYSQQVPSIEGKLAEPNRSQYFRVSIAIVVLITLIKLIYAWFNRTYGKNLIKMISTVGLSLLHKPTEWIENTIALTEQTWQKLVEDNPELDQQEIDVYVFGHSLGGLLALSWPAYINPNQQKFAAKQIITAAPTPSTEMGIPTIAIWILKLFNSPFTAEPINIRESGSKLNIPVGIMHGIDDKIVKPQSWVKPSLWQTKPNFDYIASQQKKIYFSLSKSSDLIAFHNQAVTNTEYFDNNLLKHFGGVKEEPNVYNTQYIWPGLDLVVRESAKADKLLDKFPLGTKYVKETLPEQPLHLQSLRAIASLSILALLGLGYWLLYSGTV